MLHCIRKDMKRIIFNPYFICGILIFVLMGLSGNGIYTDYSDGKQYNALEIFFELQNTEEYYTSTEYICMSGFGLWTNEFLLIITSFPFISLICDEKECGMKRQLIFKYGISRYSISKVISSLICAGLLCLIGFLFFTTACHIMFPSVYTMDPIQQETYSNIVSATYHKRLLETVLNGIEQSMLPLALSAVFPNKYFCICIPFMAEYFKNSLITRIILTTDTIANFLVPGGLSKELLYGNSVFLAGSLLLIFFFAVLLTFYFGQKLRRDTGA